MGSKNKPKTKSHRKMLIITLPALKLRFWGSQCYDLYKNQMIGCREETSNHTDIKHLLGARNFSSVH